MLIFLVIPLSESDRKQINTWIIEIAAGNEASLESLYRLVGGRLLSVAVGITGHRQMAEDALQESLVRVVKYAGSFKRRDNGYGWLCTVVRNTALNLLRAQRPEVSIDEFYNLAAGGCTEEDTALRLRIEAALAGLTLEEKRLVFLKYYNDMTVREIAAHLGLPRSTVADRLRRAEDRLRAGLREE